MAYIYNLLIPNNIIKNAFASAIAGIFDKISALKSHYLKIDDLNIFG